MTDHRKDRSALPKPSGPYPPTEEMLAEPVPEDPWMMTEDLRKET